MYFTYIVECKDKTLYCGIATDLQRRLTEHNNSKLGAKYTRARRPVKLVYSRKFKTRAAACREEARIKALDRQSKIALLQYGK